MQNNRMRVARAERQVTQFEIARRTHINQSRISLIERGYADPTSAEKTAIAKILNMPVDDVFPVCEVTK